MISVARAGPEFEDCDLFTPFWTCLRCDSTQFEYVDSTDRPDECVQCGYHQFQPEYHVLVSR